MKKTYFSHSGAFGTGFGIGLAGWVFIIVIMSCITNFKSFPELSKKGKIKVILLPAIIFLVLSCVIVYLFADKVSVSSERGLKGNKSLVQRFALQAISEEIDKNNAFANSVSITDIENNLKNKIFPVIGESIKFLENIKIEDSPGNVVVLEGENGPFIRVFGRGGFYEDISVRNGKILE